VKSELLAKSPMLALPMVALFLFIALFLGIFIITMNKRAPAYDSLARLPLEDDADDADDAQGRTDDSEGGRR
jgi:hypothetical protein